MVEPVAGHNNPAGQDANSKRNSPDQRLREHLKSQKAQQHRLEPDQHGLSGELQELRKHVDNLLQLTEPQLDTLVHQIYRHPLWSDYCEEHREGGLELGADDDLQLLCEEIASWEMWLLEQKRAPAAVPKASSATERPAAVVKSKPAGGLAIAPTKPLLAPALVASHVSPSPEDQAQLEKQIETDLTRVVTDVFGEEPVEGASTPAEAHAKPGAQHVVGTLVEAAANTSAEAPAKPDAQHVVGTPVEVAVNASATAPAKPDTQHVVGTPVEAASSTAAKALLKPDTQHAKPVLRGNGAPQASQDASKPGKKVTFLEDGKPNKALPPHAQAALAAAAPFPAPAAVAPDPPAAVQPVAAAQGGPQDLSLNVLPGVTWHACHIRVIFRSSVTPRQHRFLFRTTRRGSNIMPR